MVSYTTVQMYFFTSGGTPVSSGELWSWSAEVTFGLEREFFEGGVVGQLPPLDHVGNVPDQLCRVQVNLAVEPVAIWRLTRGMAAAHLKRINLNRRFVP